MRAIFVMHSKPAFPNKCLFFFPLPYFKLVSYGPVLCNFREHAAVQRTRDMWLPKKKSRSLNLEISGRVVIFSNKKPIPISI
jgi:hypothetical protein